MSRVKLPARRVLSSSDMTVLVGGLVVLMVAAVTVLVVAFWQSSAAGRARAWTAAEQVAHSYNQVFQSQARIRISASTTRLFALGNGMLADNPLPALAAMAAARYDPNSGCPCSRIRPRYAFLVDPAAPRMVIIGDTAGHRARQRVAATGRAAARVAADSVQSYAVAGHDSAGAWIIYYRAIGLANGHRAAYGFEVPAEILDTALLRPTIEQMRADRWGTAEFRDSIFSVEAFLGDSLVFASQPRFAGGPSAIGRYPGGFQILRSRLTLNPAATHHVLPGGIPSVPRAALLSLLALAALLGAAALYLLRRARALVTLREDFASSVSHELRTPLTQILLFSEMLALERGDTAARQRAGAVIVRETRRLIHLVENVLVFARGRRPGARLALAVHDLSGLTAAVVEDGAALAGKFEATLRGDIADGVAADVDPDAWRQIVLNLVDNALRYGPAGQQVRISLCAEGDFAVLQVDDQGRGVPPSERARIWQPYERLSNGLMERAGTGIGLAIVAQLVELLHGTTAVTDAPGGGARFMVRLPLVAALHADPRPGGQREAGAWPRS